MDVDNLSSSWLRRSHWWNCDRSLDRVTYAGIGVTLMLVKYIVEAGVIRFVMGRFYSPLDFINPLASARSRFTEGGPAWINPAWLAWTLAFVTVAVILTIRRAVDAGASPWLGLGILVPIANFVVMIAMAVLPSKEQPAPSSATLRPVERSTAASQTAAMLVGTGIGALYALCLTVISVYLFNSYGAALFFGTPVIAGTFAAYTYNFHERRGWISTLLISLAPVVLLGLGLILLAFEGAVCLLMALPLMFPPALVGGIAGKAIADLKRADLARRRELIGCLLALPAIAFGESRLSDSYEYCVESSVDVEAPLETVWNRVVDFPPIQSPSPLMFRLGIAEPKGARIDGRGVGAVRNCDFTTGSFEEPITTWAPPRRLAFDVTKQPDPMIELSPYSDVHPPHLKRSFRSTRGEFLLKPQGATGTRLTGRTWYRIDLAPAGYFTFLADRIIHQIHLRVLEHVKALAEADANEKE